MLAFHLWWPLFYALKAAKTDHFFGNFRVSGISSSQQGAPTTWLQPDLLESFPADVIPDITGQFGCRHRAKFSPSVEKGGETGLWQIAHSNYSRRQIPSDTLNCLFSSTTFLTRTNYFFEISQPAQIWGTDPLVSPVWRSYNNTDSFYLPFLVKSRHHHINSLVYILRPKIT